MKKILDESERYDAARMTEARFQACVIGLAQRLNWLVYHTYDSRRSASGYPDLHLVHRDHGLSIFRELKTVKGRVSPTQQEWIDWLTAAGADVAVWRPTEWFDGTIRDVLYNDFT